MHKLVSENLELKKHLVKEWLTNHAEHSGAPVSPWPHNGICK